MAGDAGRMRRVLTIAGSDSGGGDGIQADLKTSAAMGVFGTSAITSVTAQNTMGVQGVHDLPPEFVGRQIDSVLEGIAIDATCSIMTKPVASQLSGINQESTSSSLCRSQAVIVPSHVLNRSERVPILSKCIRSPASL